MKIFETNKSVDTLLGLLRISCLGLFVAEIAKIPLGKSKIKCVQLYGVTVIVQDMVGVM